MKKLVIAGIVALGLVWGVKAAQAWYLERVDWKCVNDCTRMGYMWGYCKKACSY